MVAQYFAQIDANNIVTNVAVVSQEFLEANPERYSGTWIETFIGVEGKVYAGIGLEYLPETQNFRPQSPFVSWAWVNNTWQAPTPKPSGLYWRWNEEELAWVAI